MTIIEFSYFYHCLNYLIGNIALKKQYFTSKSIYLANNLKKRKSMLEDKL